MRTDPYMTIRILSLRFCIESVHADWSHVMSDYEDHLKTILDIEETNSTGRH